MLNSTLCKFSCEFSVVKYCPNDLLTSVAKYSFDMIISYWRNLYMSRFWKVMLLIRYYQAMLLRFLCYNGPSKKLFQSNKYKYMFTDINICLFPADNTHLSDLFQNMVSTYLTFFNYWNYSFLFYLCLLQIK